MSWSHFSEAVATDSPRAVTRPKHQLRASQANTRAGLRLTLTGLVDTYAWASRRQKWSGVSPEVHQPWSSELKPHD